MYEVNPIEMKMKILVIMLIKSASMIRYIRLARLIDCNSSLKSSFYEEHHRIIVMIIYLKLVQE